MVLKCWDKHKDNFTDMKTKCRKLGELSISVVVKSRDTNLPSLFSPGIHFLFLNRSNSLVSQSSALWSSCEIHGGKDGVNDLTFPSPYFWKKSPKQCFPVFDRGWQWCFWWHRFPMQEQVHPLTSSTVGVPMPKGEVLHRVTPHGDQHKSPSQLQILQWPVSGPK